MWIAFTLMALESYYHPIRECGILVILLLFPVGSEYNGEGQGLMQFISHSSESFIIQWESLPWVSAGGEASTRTTPFPKTPLRFLHYLHFVNRIKIDNLTQASDK